VRTRFQKRVCHTCLWLYSQYIRALTFSKSVSHFFAMQHSQNCAFKKVWHTLFVALYSKYTMELTLEDLDPGNSSRVFSACVIFFNFSFFIGNSFRVFCACGPMLGCPCVCARTTFSKVCSSFFLSCALTTFSIVCFHWPHVNDLYTYDSCSKYTRILYVVNILGLFVQ